MADRRLGLSPRQIRLRLRKARARTVLEHLARVPIPDTLEEAVATALAAIIEICPAAVDAAVA